MRTERQAADVERFRNSSKIASSEDTRCAERWRESFQSLSIPGCHHRTFSSMYLLTAWLGIWTFRPLRRTIWWPVLIERSHASASRTSWYVSDRAFCALVLRDCGLFVDKAEIRVKGLSIGEALPQFSNARFIGLDQSGALVCRLLNSLLRWPLSMPNLLDRWAT